MSEEIKSLFALILDCVKIEQDIEGKEFFLFMIPDLVKAATEVPDVIAHWKDLLPEVLALKEMPNQADLITYIQSKFKSVISDQKANDILQAVLQFMECFIGGVVGLQKALNE